MFFLVPSNFWAYLYQEAFLYNNQGSAELFQSQQIWNISCVGKSVSFVPTLFTSVYNQPQYSSTFWNLEKCQVSSHQNNGTKEY